MGQKGVAEAAAAPLAAHLPPGIQSPAVRPAAVSYICTLPRTTIKGRRAGADASERVPPQPTPCQARASIDAHTSIWGGACLRASGQAPWGATA
jgi:hypothetical protein